MKETLGISERRACRVLCHPRSTECYAPRPVEDEQVLTRFVGLLMLDLALTRDGVDGLMDGLLTSENAPDRHDEAERLA